MLLLVFILPTIPMSTEFNDRRNREVWNSVYLKLLTSSSSLRQVIGEFGGCMHRPCSTYELHHYKNSLVEMLLSSAGEKFSVLTLYLIHKLHKQQKILSQYTNTLTCRVHSGYKHFFVKQTAVSNVLVYIF